MYVWRCIRLDDVSNAITSSIKEISATPQQARLKVHAPLTAAMAAAGLEFMIRVKLNDIQEDILDSIPSPSLEIQIIAGKVYFSCKVKTLQGVVNKL